MKIERRPKTIKDLHYQLCWVYSLIAVFCVIFAAKAVKDGEGTSSVVLDLLFAAGWTCFAISSFRDARRAS